MTSTEVLNYIERQYGGLISPLHRAVMLYEVERHRSMLIGCLETDVDHLIDTICSHYGISRWLLMSRTRKRTVVTPRHVLAWMLRKKIVKNSLSYEAIGVLLGDRDYTTAMHAEKTIDNLIGTDSQVRKDVMHLLNRFGWVAEWMPITRTLNYMAPNTGIDQ